MSNENKRPWYKNPAYLTIIAIIAAAIISSPIWGQIIFPPPADFSIAIDPMQGAVQQGGVITTSITIRGINGYEYPVSLSATGQPSGVVVTFVPPIGGPTPSYTSSVTINVDPSVPAGVYTIIIKGTGANGKEHGCNYILTVTPMQVTPKSTPAISPTPTITPTPTPPPTLTPTPPPDFEIEFTYPTDGMEITSRGMEVTTIPCRGKVIGGDIEGLRVRIKIITDKSYPQGIALVKSDGSWKVDQIYLGGAEHAIYADLLDRDGNVISTNSIIVTRVQE